MAVTHLTAEQRAAFEAFERSLDGTIDDEGDWRDLGDLLGMPLYPSGGYVTAKPAGMVGERGPETIAPASALGAMRDLAQQSVKAGTVTITVRGQGPVTRKGLTDEQASGLSEIGFAAVEGEPQIVSVPAGVAGAQDCVSVGFAFLTPEARDNIGNAAIALQEYSAKAEQEALKVEAEQTTALAIERSMAFR